MFIRLVAPKRLLGSVHQELIDWWTRPEAKTHQLVLLPRAHQKSMLVAYRVAWEITRNPAITILYISSTANLAEKQLKVIKDILLSDIYRRYWPTMVQKDEGKREKWTSTEMAVDHPMRAEEGIRDSTVFTAGLTTNITGLHCDICVLDDVVVKENAYTNEGRSKVESQYSLLASIENPEALEWVVGTRYHLRDLYNALKEMEEDIYNEAGEIITSESVYEIFERVVETDNEFLWPRHQRSDGKWFGFNRAVLEKKKAQYLDKTQYFAQYYNDPNDKSNAPIKADLFVYYEKKDLSLVHGYWYYGQRKLSVYAAIDFAFSTKKKADYTALVVIGIDSEENIYVLDIDRFKTDRIVDYFDAIKRQYFKWGFKKLRAEVTVAQKVIVRDLKTQIAKENIYIIVDEFRPSRHDGTKEERMTATLQPRYDLQRVYHYRGGNCQTLEDELIHQHPAHDDVKDALTSAIDIARPPVMFIEARAEQTNNNLRTHSRFGGVI